MNREKIIQHIKAIKDNYPPSKYSMLCEALNEAITRLEFQIPRQAIKTETSSQACPICFTNVNGNYCKECGQRISY